MSKQVEISTTCENVTMYMAYEQNTDLEYYVYSQKTRQDGVSPIIFTRNQHLFHFQNKP